MKALTCILSLLFLVNGAHPREIEIETPPTPVDYRREASCNYNRLDKFIQCDSDVGSLKCDAEILGFAHTFKHYRISRLKESRGEKPIMWFRLYAKKPDNSGWYFFKGMNGLPMRMTIHSRLRKAKKYDQGFVVNDIECWTKLKDIILGSTKYKQIKIDKYITEEDTFTEKESRPVKTIGTLLIV